MNLTPKQRAFADFYIELGNATEAARRAGYSKKTAGAIGTENLGKPAIRGYIAQRQAEIESERTASLKEIQELRTAIMRGQEKDQFGIETSIADRLRAAGDLEKSLRIKEEQETKAAARASAHYELPARVIGRAFVDINRRIQPNMTYVFEGGRGGLKSSYISLKIVELLKNNPTMHACIIRKMGNTLKDSVYAQMKWAINELGLYDEFKCKLSPLEIVLKETGQTIYFRGCDDPLKLKSIKPPFGYIGILWKEEKDQLCGPEEERSINQSVLRGGADSYDFSSYNPPKSKSSWVNKERLVPNPGRVFHHSSYTDAPPEWLGSKFIADAEHLKEVNPAAYEHEYEGVANGDGGSVFDYLELREITDEEISHFDRIFQGEDWGWYPDPYCFIRCYYDSDREAVYIFAEHYANKESNEQTARWIIEHGYDDYTITADSAEPKSVNDHREMGLPVTGAVKGPGSIEHGMKWLQRRRIIIDPVRCPNAAKEFSEYEYERDRDGNVVTGYPDVNNHSIDATRYALEPLTMRRGGKCMKINIPLDSVKKQIREEFHIAPLVTPEMREAEDLWMQIWMGTPPWANDQDRTINFAKAVTGEAARLATMGVSVELSGSARADWLQERLNEELIPFLRDMVDVGCAAGMFLLKPTPDSIGMYTPPEFTITAVDNRKRVTGVVLYDTKATPDYYYVKAEYHRYDGMHYVVSNRAFRLAKGKASASRVNLDEVPDWVGILPDAVLDDTAPLFAVCTMPDANNIDGGACGMSIYANALPELRGLDVAWSAMVDEIQDSRSIALVDDRLLREPGRKNVSVRLPRYVQNVAGSAAESFYQEIDRKLKTVERQTGINMLLQSLSTKCGFSEGYFSYNEKQGLATATQVEADDRRTIQRIKDIRDRIRAAVDDLIQALNDYADIYDLAPYGTYTVSYNFGDITYSYEEDRQNTKSLCQLGVLPWWMYLVRFEGFSEDDAKAAYAEANTAEPGLFPDTE